MNKPDWTPQLEGDMYCSPACGAWCSKKDYDEAVNQSELLAARLGTAWKPHVWENFGWHYSAVKGVCAVVPPAGYRQTYTAYFNATIRQVIGRHDDPVLAVKAAIGEFQKMLIGAKAERLALFASKKEYTVNECTIESSTEDGYPDNMHPIPVFETDNLHDAIAKAHELTFATANDTAKLSFCVYQPRIESYRDWYYRKESKKCNCPCHTLGPGAIMHCMPCC